MNHFTCPICKQKFEQKDRTLVCPKGHSFDMARGGYVNLLRPGKGGSVRHGDDKLMVRARTEFLGAGFYDPLRDAVTDTVLRHAEKNGKLLDAGCGEGFYTAHIRHALAESGRDFIVFGIDVSKDAVHACAVRDKGIRLAVASIFDLPAENESMDILLNLFAPYDAAEFSRVLKKSGTLIRVFPRERHLWELKCAVYDTPYENEIDTLALAGFTLVGKTPVTFDLHLKNTEEISSLFKMTPYYYKTSREDQKKLENLKALDTHGEFLILEYKKEDFPTDGDLTESPSI